MKTAFTVGIGVLMLLALTTFVSQASAEEPSQKFARGALNTTTGWAELPFQVATQSAENAFHGMTYGFIDGVSRAAQRTLYGVWDWVTFLIPPFDKPMMEPETLFETK